MFVAATSLVTIAGFEDYRETAYIPVKGDKPTIGYGSTAGVKMGQKTTPARALMRLNDEVQGIYADGLKKCIKVPLYYHEFGAYVSLAYSVGVPTVCKKANKNPKDKHGNPLPPEPDRLIDLINAQKYAEACERISAFVYGPDKTKPLPGLIKRRAVERAMCEGY